MAMRGAPRYTSARSSAPRRNVERGIGPPRVNRSMKSLSIDTKRGWLDWELERLADLEENYRSWGSGSEGV